MKKVMFLFVLLIVCVGVSAQSVKVLEPEFENSYCMLTSDSTYVVLPKESGTIGKHETKTKSILKNIGRIADVAATVGGLSAVTSANSGNFTGAMNGLKAMNTAGQLGNVASTASSLAGSTGMDIIFPGKSSSYVCQKNNRDVRILVKASNNDADPMGIYRIVRFNTIKKERRIQWFEIESSMLGSAESKKSGFLNFEAHKYGKQSYLLTIPSSVIETGEYGIFYMDIITATSIPVGTFSVK